MNRAYRVKRAGSCLRLMLWTAGSHKKEHIVFAAAKILNNALIAASRGLKAGGLVVIRHSNFRLCNAPAGECFEMRSGGQPTAFTRAR